MEIDIPVFNPVKEKCQLRKLEKFNIVLRPELAKSILTQDLDFSVELPSGLTLYPLTLTLAPCPLTLDP